jgi:hypothetical protein
MTDIIAASDSKKTTSFAIVVLITITALYEGIILATAIFLSPIVATILLSIITTIIVNAIVFLLNTKYPLKFVDDFKTWAGKKQANLNPKITRLVEISKIGGTFISSLLLGPPPTALLIDALGYKKPWNYILATSSGIFFCVTWILTYNGSVTMLEALFKKMPILVH